MSKIAVASQLIPPFILLRPVFYVQEHAGYYHGAAYYLSRFVANIPTGIVETFIFSIIVYSMSGLHGDVFIGSHFWFFWLTMFGINITSSMTQLSISLIIIMISNTHMHLS
jgi:ABC-type multidrug transport system permease subunit